MATLPRHALDKAFDALLHPEPPPRNPKSPTKPSEISKAEGLPVKTSRDYENKPRKPPKDRKPWMCHAHLNDPLWPGRQCEVPRLLGQKVCRVHGGGSPQALKKARERLAALVPEADRALADMVTQRDHLPTTLNAVKEVYDRVEGPVKGGGLGSGIQVQVGFLMPKNGNGDGAVGIRVLADGTTVDADVIEEEIEDQ